MDQIESILKSQDSRIKNFESLSLTKNDLTLVNELLKKKEYNHVHFINWKENKSLLDKYVEIKIEIYQCLITNMLRENHLVIDLTNYEIDEDFLKQLSDALETNKYIGALFLSQYDENRFESSESKQKISKYLRRNNENFRRFPSDYIHCLLASHCFSDRDATLEKKIGDMGWEVEEELLMKAFTKEEQKNDNKPNMYLSILYKNESTRQLVLAFRGVKLKVKDWFAENSQLEAVVYGTLANEITSNSYYAYEHSKIAYEMSQKLNFSLSFTGYSFGAWLAEQSVYFCYKDFNQTRKVRAVTFDSPGSWDIIQELANTNINNRNTSKEELAKFLDIKTYLFSPNFMNTSKEHIGRVFRVFEHSLIQGEENDSVDIWDDFIMNKFISKIPWEPVRKTFEKWYSKIVKCNLVVKKVGIKVVKKIAPKYLFYLNGLRALFSDDIKWLLGQFEKNENFEIELKEVIRWPKMNFRPKSERFEDINLAEKATALVPMIGSIIPEKLRSILSKPIDAALNRGLKLLIKHCFSSLAVFYNILAEISDSGLNDEQCLLCYEYDRVILNDETLLNKDGFDLVFQGCYEIRNCNLFEDRLFILDPTHLDNQIIKFFYDKNKSANPKLNDQFSNLGKKLHVKKDRDGSYDVFILRSKESNISVDAIRERFERLYDLNEAFEGKYTKKSINLCRNLGEKHQLNTMKNSNFVKEDERIFEKIDKILENSQYCYIYGKSGYGKSTLAYEYGFYVKEYSEQFYVHSIVSGDEMENLIELSSRFLDPINLEDTEPENLIRKIGNKIDLFERRILFIFDNLTTFENIELILNILNDHKFIITTKNHDLFKKQDRTRKFGIDLNGYNEHWCIEYLKANNIYSEDEKKNWVDLINRCAGGKMPPQSLYNLINDINEKKFCNFEDLEKILNGDLFKKYQFIMEKNNIAFNVLQYLAYLDGSGIDYGIIKEIFINHNDIESSLNYLAKYGYLKEEQLKVGKITYKMHDSIQNELKNNIQSDKEEQIQLNIIENLNRLIKKEINTEINLSKWEARKIDRLKELERHGTKIYKKYKNFENKDILIEFLDNIIKLNSEVFINIFKEEEIEKYILEIKKQTLPANHPDISMSYNKIGKVLRKQGKYEEALENHDKSLKIALETLEANHPNIAASYNNIGLILSEQGRLEEALENYEKCLKIQLETLPANHLNIAFSYNNIGNIFIYQGKYKQAVENYEKSLKIQIETFTVNHLGIASLYNNIGIALRNQGKYDEALVSYEKCLKIRKELLPANHPDIAATYNNMGLLLNYQGKYDEALACYEESLKIRNEILPANHPDIAATYNNIGMVLSDQGHLEEALENYEKCLGIQLETLPANHPSIAATYNNIGLIFSDQGKYEKALENYNKCLNIRKKILPENHPDLGASYNNIGIVLRYQEKYNEALENYERCLKIQLETLQPNHPSIAASYNNIGLILNDQGKYEEALENFEKGLKIKLETLPEDHPSFASSYNNIGMVLSDIGKLEESLENYKRCLNIQTKTLPANHSSIAVSYNNIGSVLRDQGKYEEALANYKKSLKINLESLPGNHAEIANSYNNLGLVLSDQEKYKEALENYNKCLNIRKEILPANHPKLQSVYTSIEVTTSKMVPKNSSKNSNICLVI